MICVVGEAGGKGPEGHFGILQLSFLMFRSKMGSTAQLVFWFFFLVQFEQKIVFLLHFLYNF